MESTRPYGEKHDSPIWRGGIVSGAIGKPQLAIVHGGETVSPKGSGINIYVTVQGSVTADRDLASTVASEVNRILDRDRTWTR